MKEGQMQTQTQRPSRKSALERLQRSQRADGHRARLGKQSAGLVADRHGWQSRGLSYAAPNLNITADF